MKPSSLSRPSKILRTLPGILTKQFEAGVVFTYRRILDPPHGTSLLTAQAAIPFDQLEAQLEFQLAEHFRIKPAIIQRLFQRVRERLEMHPRTGVAPPGSPGKNTLRSCSRNSLPIDFDHWWTSAVTLAAEESARLRRADRTFEKYFRKHQDKLLNMLLLWTGNRHALATDIAQEAWLAALLLIDPNRRWSLRFVYRIARNLLRSHYAGLRAHPEIRFLDGLALGDEFEGLGAEDEPFFLASAPEVADMPAADDEPPRPLPLRVFEVLLRTILQAPCLPLDRAIFLRTVLLRHPPRFIVRDDANTTLGDFVGDIQRDFAFTSHLTETTVRELFKGLRGDLAKTFFDSARDGRRRAAYPRLHKRITATTRIRDYFLTRDVTQRAKQVTRWAENVKKYLWDQGIKTGTPLNEVLRDLPPDWLERGERTYAAIRSRLLPVISVVRNGGRDSRDRETTTRRLVPFNFDIKDDGGGEFLFRWRSLDGKYDGESVHQTLKDAFGFGEREFGIDEAEWSPPEQA